MYFPPPPTLPSTSSKRVSRESPRFSILGRKRSKELDQENYSSQIREISAPIRTWPRYYPIMPDQNFGIGIATTTDHSQPIIPVRSPTYSPVPAPKTDARRATSPTPNFSLSRNPSTATLPSYQPHAFYTNTVHQPPQPPQAPAAVYASHSRNTSQSSRNSRHVGQARKSKAFSFMTDIEEGEQVSTRETSLAEMSGSSSCESLPSSSAPRATASPSMKKSRRPTLTINIPGQSKPQMEFPPPPPPKTVPASKPAGPSRVPPQQQMPRLPLSVAGPNATNARSIRSSPPSQQHEEVQKPQAPSILPTTQDASKLRSTPPLQQVPAAASARTSPAVQQGPRRANSNSSAPMLQALASRASQRSAARPKPALALDTQRPNARPSLALNTQHINAPPAARPTLALNTQRPAVKAPTRPPLLREDQVQQIANSPSDILKAANSYARARKPSPESMDRDSVSSAALPSSNVMGPATFLLSDSEGKSSSRSNSSVRRASKGQSRSGRRASDASVTSFEDDCSESEDETPPKEENRSLSPVIEASPVSTLRYPKVPRQANQVVPRSPGTPKNAIQPNSPARHSTPTRASNGSRPDVNIAAAAAATQGIGNRLWKTELSPHGKQRPPEWSHRRSESWEKWAQSTPDSLMQTPKPPFAANGGSAPKLTPTRRGDELFLDLRFSASTLGPASPKRP